jgi:SagB-type dehydrogenase family enzyme
MQLPADDAMTLALLYHLNSGVWSNTEATAESNYEQQYKSVPDAQPITLAAPADHSELAKLIEKRRSCRRFAARTMPFENLSRILHSSYGTTGLRHDTGLPWPIWGRAVPSAGALYPLEIYAGIRNVEGIADGVFHYNAVERQLERITRCGVKDLWGCLFYPEFVEHANLLLMISAVFKRTMKKYGPRGYRYILLEAGHCAENICLLAAEDGLATLCMGGFHDAVCTSTLGLAGPDEAVVYCIGAGFPSPI